MKITKKAISEFIRNKLKTDYTWAARALLLIYRNQTTEEKEWEVTLAENGVGFTGCDAQFLSSLAKQLETRKFLTPGQKCALHRTIPKYWRQVFDACDKDRLEKLCSKNLKMELA